MSRKRKRVLTACHQHYSLALAEDKNVQLTHAIYNCHLCKRGFTRKYYEKKKIEKSKQLELINLEPSDKEKLAREARLQNQREYKKNLASGYVRGMIVTDSDLKAKDIPDDVVNAWAELIKLKRFLREMKKK